MTEKEFINSIKPKLKQLAFEHTPTAPSISRIKVHDFNGTVYSLITFLATSKYKRIDGETVTETYYCRYDGKLSVS